MVDPHDRQAVRLLLQERRTEILETYQAEGVGVGRQDDTYVIVVYLDSEAKRPLEPITIEGVPLRFELTGSFRTLTLP